MFETERARLFALAYRLLGSASEGEDVVQDAFLRWHGVDQCQVDSPRAWLAKVVTNLCLTRLTAARTRRETYAGPWLPEPVATDTGALGPLETAEQRELVSFALLTLLERLNPVERAVFVLREAFGYSYRQIAAVLDLSEPNCRQLASRARGRLTEARTRFEVSGVERRRLLERFLAAARVGDLARLERMFAADVVAWTDGGGKVSAALRPVIGPAKVARYFVGGLARAGAVNLRMMELNGQVGLVATAPGGAVFGAVTLEAVGSQISRVRTVANPDKLAYLAKQLSHPHAVLGP
ncbi:RNA polymerase sigma-70 factor [Actinopolymorpha alba]|uniref:RNA polymerase sigma-70 factor n=1 Tax=Actinopolymorpha alba TaxID=533267 RepID=UPI000377FCE5|nr:RNA polymerase sigma-70 factor [Actinopolymorpha alba]